ADALVGNIDLRQQHGGRKQPDQDSHFLSFRDTRYATRSVSSASESWFLYEGIGDLPRCRLMLATSAFQNEYDRPTLSRTWIENESSFTRTPVTLEPFFGTTVTNRKSSGTAAPGSTSDSRRCAGLRAAPMVE